MKSALLALLYVCLFSFSLPVFAEEGDEPTELSSPAVEAQQTEVSSFGSADEATVSQAPSETDSDAVEKEKPVDHKKSALKKETRTLINETASLIDSIENSEKTEVERQIGKLHDQKNKIDDALDEDSETLDNQIRSLNARLKEIDDEEVAKREKAEKEKLDKEKKDDEEKLADKDKKDEPATEEAAPVAAKTDDAAKEDDKDKKDPVAAVADPAKPAADKPTDKPAEKPATLAEAQEKNKLAVEALAKKDSDLNQASAKVGDTYKQQVKVDDDIKKNIEEYNKRIKENPQASVADLQQQRAELDRKHNELQAQRKVEEARVAEITKARDEVAKERDKSHEQLSTTVEKHNAQVADDAKADAAARIAKHKSEGDAIREDIRKEEARQAEIRRKAAAEAARQQAAADKAAAEKAAAEAEAKRVAAAAPKPVAAPAPKQEEQGYLASAWETTKNIGGFAKEVVTGGQAAKDLAATAPSRVGNLVVGSTVGLVDGVQQGTNNLIKSATAPSAPSTAPKGFFASTWESTKETATNVAGFTKEVLTGGQAAQDIKGNTKELATNVGGFTKEVVTGGQAAKDLRQNANERVIDPTRNTIRKAGEATVETVTNVAGFGAEVLTGGDAAVAIAHNATDLVVDPAKNIIKHADTLASGCTGTECSMAVGGFGLAVAETGMNVAGVGAAGAAAVKGTVAGARAVSRTFASTAKAAEPGTAVALRSTETQAAAILDRNGEVIGQTTFKEVADVERVATSVPALPAPRPALPAPKPSPAAADAAAASEARLAQARTGDFNLGGLSQAERRVLAAEHQVETAGSAAARSELESAQAALRTQASEAAVRTEARAATPVAEAAPIATPVATPRAVATAEELAAASEARLAQARTGDFNLGGLSQAERNVLAAEQQAEARLAQARTGDFNLGGLSQAERNVLAAENQVRATGSAAAKAELESAQAALRTQAKEAVAFSEARAATPVTTAAPVAAPVATPRAVTTAEELAAASEARLAQARTGDYNLGGLTQAERQVLAAEQQTARLAQTTEAAASPAPVKYVSRETAEAGNFAEIGNTAVASKPGEIVYTNSLATCTGVGVCGVNGAAVSHLMPSQFTNPTAVKGFLAEMKASTGPVNRIDVQLGTSSSKAEAEALARTIQQEMPGVPVNITAGSKTVMTESMGYQIAEDGSAQLIKVGRAPRIVEAPADKLGRVVDAAESEAGSLRNLSQTQKQEILNISGNLSEAERVVAAEKSLGRSLSEAEREAVVEAHRIGQSEGRGFGTYTKADLRAKVETLTESGLSPQEADRLLRTGITGDAGKITAVDGRLASLKDHTPIGKQVSEQTARIQGEQGYAKLVDAVQTGKGSVGEALEAQERASRSFYTGHVDSSYVSRVGGESYFVAEGVQMGGIKATEVASRFQHDATKMQKAYEAIETTASEVKTAMSPQVNLKYYRLKEAALELRREIANKQNKGDYLNNGSDAVVAEIQALEAELEAVKKQLLPKLRTAIGG